MLGGEVVTAGGMGDGDEPADAGTAAQDAENVRTIVPVCCWQLVTWTAVQAVKPMEAARESNVMAMLGHVPERFQMLVRGATARQIQVGALVSIVGSSIACCCLGRPRCEPRPRAQTAAEIIRAMVSRVPMFFQNRNLEFLSLIDNAKAVVLLARRAIEAVSPRGFIWLAVAVDETLCSQENEKQLSCSTCPELSATEIEVICKYSPDLTDLDLTGCVGLCVVVVRGVQQQMACQVYCREGRRGLDRGREVPQAEEDQSPALRAGDGSNVHQLGWMHEPGGV